MALTPENSKLRRVRRGLIASPESDSVSVHVPRPKEDDLLPSLRPLVEEFARSLGTSIGKFTARRIAEEVRQTNKQVGPAGRSRKLRAKVLCYYPGCRNVAAPRFRMFCAAEHKSLSKADKEKFRLQHAEATGAQ
jgi:hypothetical protein